MGIHIMAHSHCSAWPCQHVFEFCFMTLSLLLRKWVLDVSSAHLSTTYPHPLLWCVHLSLVSGSTFEITFWSYKDGDVKWRSNVYRMDHMEKCDLGLTLFNLYVIQDKTASSLMAVRIHLKQIS